MPEERTVKALKKYWILVCLPALAGADELRFDAKRDWEKWRLPLGAVELELNGTIRPVSVQKNINAVLNAPAFEGGIREAGSNESAARFVMDGREDTGWAPDPEDSPQDWYIEVDLGRVVSATAITFVFDEEAEPFELFNVLLSGGEPLQASGNIAIEGTLVYKIKDIIRQNKQHRVTYAPGEVLEYTAIRAVRIEVLDFEPGGRLMEVEVNAIGHNVALHMKPNNGSAQMILDPDVSNEEIAVANVLPLVDGAVFTRFLDKREARYSYDTWWEFTVDLGASYWLDMVRMYGWTALRPNHTGRYSVRDREGNLILVGDGSTTQVTRAFNIGSQELRNTIDALGRRDFTLKFYEVLTSDGSLAPDGSFLWTKHFSGRRTLRDQRLGVVDHHFDLTQARLFRIRWLAWDAACNDRFRFGAAGSQGLTQGFGTCYGHGTADEYQVFGEGLPADVELTSGPIELGGDKNLMSVSWEAETPPGTRVEIRSRTGNHMRVDTTAWFDNKGEPVSQRRWNSLRKQNRAGDVTEIRNAGDDWSPWSNIYTASGQAFQSPSPREAMELSARLVSESPLTAASLDWIAVEFSAPIARSVFGEIVPTQVQPGELTEFSYYVRPMGSTQQLDQVTVAAPVPVRFMGASIGGEAVEVGEPDSLDDGFRITFPRTVLENQLVEVRFESSVFVQGTRFEAFLGDSKREAVRQRVDPGDANRQVESSTNVVRLPVSDDLISDLRVEPQVLTPNGDGINDELELTFFVANVLSPRPMRLRVFDLSGRLVHEEDRDAIAGEQTFVWDGSTGGTAVAPGVYLLELSLAGDARDDVSHRLLPVAY